MRPFIRGWLKFNLKTLFLAVLVAAIAAMAFERYWVTRPLVWQPFSAKARDDALASGKVVLIKFTAAWDDQSALLDYRFANSAELRSLIRRHGIVTIEADYTRQTRPIAKEVIRVYGQEVVPVLAVYRPDKPDVPDFAGYVVEENDLLALLRRALAAEPAPAANSFLPNADKSRLHFSDRPAAVRKSWANAAPIVVRTQRIASSNNPTCSIANAKLMCSLV